MAMFIPILPKSQAVQVIYRQPVTPEMEAEAASISQQLGITQARALVLIQEMSN